MIGSRVIVKALVFGLHFQYPRVNVWNFVNLELKLIKTWWDGDDL